MIKKAPITELFLLSSVIMMRTYFVGLLYVFLLVTIVKNNIYSLGGKV